MDRWRRDWLRVSEFTSYLAAPGGVVRLTRCARGTDARAHCEGSWSSASLPRLRPARVHASGFSGPSRGSRLLRCCGLTPDGASPSDGTAARSVRASSDRIRRSLTPPWLAAATGGVVVRSHTGRPCGGGAGEGGRPWLSSETSSVRLI
jgi:hypothetical protein